MKNTAELVWTLRVNGAIEILRDEKVERQHLKREPELVRWISFKVRPEGIEFIRLLLDGGPPRTVLGALRAGGWPAARELLSRKRHARRWRHGEGGRVFGGDD